MTITTATSPRAFVMSASFHGAIVLALLLAAYFVNGNSEPDAKVFELVAGEGDNFGAHEAPALGTPGGVKVDIPKAPEPKPTPAPVEPVVQEVAPITPAPLPTPPAPKTLPTPPPVDTPMPNFKKQLQTQVKKADAKAKREVKKEREAEAKKAAEEAKRMSKEEFDKQNKTKQVASATKAGANPKAPKIDAEGIAKGVVGGSAANKIGGAGGKVLKNDSDDLLAAYDALFKQRLRREFEPPPGLSDSLKVTMEVRSNPDGSLVNPRIVTSSGSAEFDRAVLDAIRRVRMPARPDRKSEVIEFIFTMREREN